MELEGLSYLENSDTQNGAFTEMPLDLSVLVNKHRPPPLTPLAQSLEKEEARSHFTDKKTKPPRWGPALFSQSV